ncbi:MAG: DUF932 domain-containing protein [Victivallales bacterium]|nr:DUF932 domain-containing protein [Victivallales bacterium]
MGLCLANPNDKYVDRNTLALVPTPAWTDTWHPIPHIDVVEAVEAAISDRGMTIESERFGLARDQQKMFGVITLVNRNNPEWTRCVGIRNSHDQSFAAGVCCGVSVLVCSNLCFGGEYVLKRRHTSGIDIAAIASDTIDYLTDGFITLEERLEELRDLPVPNDDWARSFVVRSAELGAIASCDILPVFREYLEPSHAEFRDRSQWSLLNAFTEVSHKFTPPKADVFHRRITRLFALDGQPSVF